MNVQEFEEVLDDAKPQLAPEGDGGEAGDKKTPEADPAKEELKQLRRELKEERQARKQAEEGMRTWYDRAAQATGKPDKTEPEPEEDKPLSVDLVEAITNGDRKAIKTALRELGFAEAAEVEGKIDGKITATRQEITRDAELYGRYPDLRDEQSEFYQTTLEIYKDLASDPVMAKSPALIATAAKQAARVLGVEESSTRRASSRRADPDDDDVEDERAARIRRQAGGGRTPRRSEADVDPAVERAARSLAQKLSQDGAAITAEGILRRAARGVTVSQRTMPRRSR